MFIVEYTRAAYLRNSQVAESDWILWGRYRKPETAARAILMAKERTHPHGQHLGRNGNVRVLYDQQVVLLWPCGNGWEVDETTQMLAEYAAVH